MKRFAPLAACLAAALPASASATNWTLDPNHSHASFTVRHLVISNVRGEFGKTAGTVNIDDRDPTKTTIEAVIDATTIDTRVPDRDKHLRSPDFFDVEKYPTITFRSTKVVPAGEGKYKVTGDLTMHGMTRPVTLDVEAPSLEIKGAKGETRRGIAATTRLNRKDFGLNWSKVVEAGPVVGDEVSIEISSELVKAGDQPKAQAATRAESK